MRERYLNMAPALKGSNRFCGDWGISPENVRSRLLYTFLIGRRHSSYAWSMTIGRIGPTTRQKKKKLKIFWQKLKKKNLAAAVGSFCVLPRSKRHRQLDECRQFDLAGVPIRALPPPPPPRIIIMSHASFSSLSHPPLV